MQQRPKTKISWRQAKDLPSKMLQPQVCPMGDTVFVGGGLGRDCMLDIYAYSISDDTWTTKVQAKTILFGMCVFKGELVTIGGGCEEGLTGKVFTLREKEGESNWVKALPPMRTERFALSVFTDNSTTIAACGGGTWVVGDESPQASSMVEVYCDVNNEWLRVRSLPRPCAAMSSTASNQTCYMFGDVHPGENTGPICAKLSDILNQNHDSTPKPEATENGIGTSDWHSLPPPPLTNTSLVATDSYLLAIGGCDDRDTSGKVHIFLKQSQKWWCLASGELPVSVESCGAAILESRKEVIVVGGEDSCGAHMDTVFIGNLL